MNIKIDEILQMISDRQLLSADMAFQHQIIQIQQQPHQHKLCNVSYNRQATVNNEETD